MTLTAPLINKVHKFVHKLGMWIHFPVDPPSNQFDFSIKVASLRTRQVDSDLYHIRRADSQQVSPVVELRSRYGTFEHRQPELVGHGQTVCTSASMQEHVHSMVSASRAVLQCIEHNTSMCAAASMCVIKTWKFRVAKIERLDF